MIKVNYIRWWEWPLLIFRKTHWSYDTTPKGITALKIKYLFGNMYIMKEERWENKNADDR